MRLINLKSSFLASLLLRKKRGEKGKTLCNEHVSIVGNISPFEELSFYYSCQLNGEEFLRRVREIDYCGKERSAKGHRGKDFRRDFQREKERRRRTRHESPTADD